VTDRRSARLIQAIPKPNDTMKTNEPRPIVCGTDFSAGAGEAAAFAAALSQRLGEPLLLVRSADERGEMPQHVREQLMNVDRPRLADEAERLRKLGLDFQEKLLRGVPDDGVAKFAERANARLVVVGASGTGALGRSGRWLLGNTAERIAETSLVPTLVVRSAELLAAWARGERALKVFVATDFTATSDAALRWVAELRQMGLCEITLGHIARPADTRADLATSDVMWLIAERPENRQALERDLRERAVLLLGAEPSIRVVPGSARVDAHLIELATDAGADLLVLGTHQWQGLDRVWHRSISRRVLHDAPMSVACVPVPAASGGEAAIVPKLTRVLVATDFSERGDQSIPYAYAVLSREGTVCLLHVTKLGESKPKEEVEALLRALVPVEAAARGSMTEVRVVESNDPASAICEAAARFGADLVCVGSHGRTALAAVVLGSVVQAIIAHCSRPVLVVRPHSNS